MITKIESIQKRIKILEVASLICVIVPAAFMIMKFILIGFGIGLMLQVWIYLSYKGIGEEKKYLKNKFGAMVMAALILLYIILKSKFSWY